MNFTRGEDCTVTWEANPAAKGDKNFWPQVRASKINGEPTAFYVIPEEKQTGPLPKPGETWNCKILMQTKPQTNVQDKIVVQLISKSLYLNLPDGVWASPNTLKALSILLPDPTANILLMGPQGCGKTTLVYTIATLEEREFRVVMGGTITDKQIMRGGWMPSDGGKDKLIAQAIEELSKTDTPEWIKWQLRLSGGGGLTVSWEDSLFVEALREAANNPHKSYLIFIDEWTRIDPEARNIALNFLDGTRPFLDLPNGERIHKRDNVRLIAAANEGQSFCLAQQDAADRDRWNVINIGYMPQDPEIRRCLMVYPDCPVELLTIAVAIISTLRTKTAMRKLRITKEASTRCSLNVARLLAGRPGVGRMGLRSALLIGVCGQYEGAPVDEGERTGIDPELEKKAGTSKDLSSVLSQETPGERVYKFIAEKLKEHKYTGD